MKVVKGCIMILIGYLLLLPEVMERMIKEVIQKLQQLYMTVLNIRHL